MQNNKMKFKSVYEILSFLNKTSSEEIMSISKKIYKDNFNGKIKLCSIFNVKSGRCSEDCKFCAQSSYHNTGIKEYDFLDKKIIIDKVLKIDGKNIKNISIVLSGRNLTDGDFKKIIELVNELKIKTKLSICVSCGFINKKQAEGLKKAGVSTYHHNIETSPDFFDNICLTHTFKDKIKTIKTAQKAGLEVCSGVIFGLGETLKDRIKEALILKKYKIKSIPINILKPVKGTFFEKNQKLSEEEILFSAALFRIINPDAMIIIAGGRPFIAENENEKLLNAGISGFMTGDYLTTEGVKFKNDINFFKKNNLTFIK